MTELFERIVDRDLLIRRIDVRASNIVSEASVQQIDASNGCLLITRHQRKEAEAVELAKEKKMQNTVLQIKKKFGKNPILRE